MSVAVTEGEDTSGVAFEALGPHLAALEEENAHLRIALRAAVGAELTAQIALLDAQTPPRQEPLGPHLTALRGLP